MIDPRARILLFFLGLAVLVLAVNLVRKRQLQERYALVLAAGRAGAGAGAAVRERDRPPGRVARFRLSARPAVDAGGCRADADHRSAFVVNVQPGRSDQVLTQELGLLRTELAELKAEADRVLPSCHAEAAEASPLHRRRDFSRRRLRMTRRLVVSC